MQELGGSCRGGGHVEVEWLCRVGWVMQWWGGVGHVGVGWCGSCRGGVCHVGEGCIM